MAGAPGVPDPLGEAGPRLASAAILACMLGGMGVEPEGLPGRRPIPGLLAGIGARAAGLGVESDMMMRRWGEDGGGVERMS
jgi:hypothetical protein